MSEPWVVHSSAEGYRLDAEHFFLTE
jgi:hypothetical protein